MSYGDNSFGAGPYGVPAESNDGGTTVNCTLGTATASGFDASISIIPDVDFKIAVIGDSNASGRCSNNQPAPSSGAYLYDNSGAVVALADPWDGGTDTYSILDDGASADGSFIPRLAQHYADAGKTTLWVPANKGGTQTSDWTRSLSTSTHYGAMKARIDAVGGVDIINIHLGANDGIGGVSQSTFVSRMNQLITDLHGDFPSARLVLHKIQDFSGYGSQITVIRAGVQEVWDNHANVERGADFDGITTAVHYTTDADAIAVAERMYAELEGYNVYATTGTATASGFDATVSNSSGLTVNCSLGTADASGFDATVSLGMTISCTQGAASAVGYTAVLEMAYTVAASIGTATASGFTATISTGAGLTLTADDLAAIADAVWSHIHGKFASRFGKNKFVTDPSTGIATLYDDDGTTVLQQWSIFEDAAGSQTYRGQGAERRVPL